MRYLFAILFFIPVFVNAQSVTNIFGDYNYKGRLGIGTSPLVKLDIRGEFYDSVMVGVNQSITGNSPNALGLGFSGNYWVYQDTSLFSVLMLGNTPVGNHSLYAHTDGDLYLSTGYGNIYINSDGGKTIQLASQGTWNNNHVQCNTDSVSFIVRHGHDDATSIPRLFMDFAQYGSSNTYIRGGVFTGYGQAFSEDSTINSIYYKFTKDSGMSVYGKPTSGILFQTLDSNGVQRFVAEDNGSVYIKTDNVYTGIDREGYAILNYSNTGFFYSDTIGGNFGLWSNTYSTGIQNDGNGLIIGGQSWQTNMPTGTGYVLTDVGGGGTLSMQPSGWGLQGNSGTDPSINFVGTTDAQPLIFKMNNQYAGFIGTGHNVAFGVNALNYPNSTGDHCVAIGQSALHNLTSGNGNTAIGNNAGSSITSENNNTVIGNGADVIAGAQSSVALGSGETADTSRTIYNSTITSLSFPSMTAGAGSIPLDANGTGRYTAQQLIVSGATLSEPSNPYLGQFYFDTTLVKMKFWNGTAWAIITSTP